MVAINLQREAQTQADQMNEDWLLDCLLVVSRLLETDASEASLIAGLPLQEGRLTPSLAVRAAAHANLAATLKKRPLKSLGSLLLPAILILKDGRACVALAREGDEFLLNMPEIGAGEQKVSIENLESEYTGEVIFIQRQLRFDKRTSGSILPRVQHWFWDVIALSWPIYAEVLIAAFMINLFALAMPLFVMNVYDRVVPNNAQETLWVLAIGVTVVFLFDFLMRTLRSYFIDVAGKRTSLILASNIFEKVMAIRMEARPASVGAFANNFQEFESFREFLTSATLATLVDLPFLILFLGIVWAIGGELVWVPVAVIPLVLIVGLLLQIPLKRTLVGLFQHSSHKGAHLIEALSTLETVKMMGGEGHMQAQWEQVSGEIANYEMKSRFLSNAMVNLTNFAQQFAGVLVVFLGVGLIHQGELSVGGLIACTILTGRALAPMGQVASLLTRYQQARVSLGTLDHLMHLPVEREAATNYIDHRKLHGKIEFREVVFSYPEQPVAALNEVSFKIKVGEKIGVVGRIGSGKSTVEKLMLALYQPQQGTILVDDKDIRQLDPADLRRNISYVPQDVALFFGSVKDNIVFGSRFSTEQEIISASELSGVSDFVNQHPLGLDMPVGENGSALSGGQRQCIAIGRALMNPGNICIMDEPTNQMDNRSEDKFKNNFKAWLGDRTLLLITHRASMLSLVDRLIVMDGGRIVADGPKDAVLAALKSGQIKMTL